MKILAGTQRKRKTPASFTVTTPETDAGPQPAASPSAAAALAKYGLLARIIWGLLLLSLAESMVLAGMVYRMPMEQFVDQAEVPPDPAQAQVVLADQVKLLGLKDKSGQAALAVPSDDIGPIHSPAVTRLEDADIPGLPANLAKQQQAATVAGSQAMPGAPQVPPVEEALPDLPAPDQIPRAKMPVLDFHSILEQALPTETKPATTPASAPDTPAHAPPATSERPRLAVPAQAGIKATPPGHLSAPVELYRPGGLPVPDALPPAGGMRITPHPAPVMRQPTPVQHNGTGAVTAPVEIHGPAIATVRAPSDAAPPAAHPSPSPASQGQVDAAPRYAGLAPHGVHPSDDGPLPSEAIAPPGAMPALIGRPSVITPPVVVPPPARLRPPPIVVPSRPVLPRPPIILDRPPGVMPDRSVDRPPPVDRLEPSASDTESPVQERQVFSRDRPARQEDAPDAMPQPPVDPAP